MQSDEVTTVKILSMEESSTTGLNNLVVANVLLDRLLKIRTGGVSSDVMASMESLSPGLLDDENPVNSFTQFPSQTNITYAMEGLVSRIVELVGKILKGIWNSVIKVLKWGFNFLSNTIMGKSSRQAKLAVYNSKGVLADTKKVNVEEYYTQGKRLAEFIEDNYKSMDSVNAGYALWIKNVDMSVSAGSAVTAATSEVLAASERSTARDGDKYLEDLKKDFTRAAEDHANGSSQNGFYEVLDDAYKKYDLTGDTNFTNMTSAVDSNNAGKGVLFVTEDATWPSIRIIGTRWEALIALDKEARRVTGGGRPSGKDLAKIMNSDFMQKGVQRGILSSMKDNIKRVEGFVGKKDVKFKGKVVEDPAARASYDTLSKHINIASKNVTTMMRDTSRMFTIASKMDIARTNMLVSYNKNCK